MKIKVENGLEIVPTELSFNHSIIMALIGWMDNINGPIFEKSMSFIIDEKEYNTIIFDLNQVEYINSGGIRIFGLLLKKVQKSHGEIVFANVSDKVPDVFKEMGFFNFFKFFGTVEEALKALNL